MKKSYLKKLVYGLIAVFIVLVGISCVGDNEPPTITPISQIIEYGVKLDFSELASVEDNRSEEIELSIVSSELDGITVDGENQRILFENVGNYEIELSAEDEAGNVSYNKVVIEVVDKTDPVIESEQTEFSIAEVDEKADYLSSITAYDEIDGDLNEKIKIDDSEVKYGEVGKYQITASVSDSTGNICTRNFDVVIKDTTAPVLTLSKTSFSLTVGETAPNYVTVATANDGVDGDITEAIVIDDSKVDYDSAGTYEVTYTITDNSGNSSTQSANVTVKEKVVKKSTNTSSNTNSNSTSSGGGQVMITKTGACYHTHKCGNGNYFWVSLSEAKSRGLRACEKCY